MAAIIFLFSGSISGFIFSSKKLAGWTGLEPAAFRVTGGRYNQLNYHPAPRVDQYSETKPRVQPLFLGKTDGTPNPKNKGLSFRQKTAVMGAKQSPTSKD